MVLADQLLTGIPGDLAELVVDVGDEAVVIGDGDDGGLVECVAELLELCLRVRPPLVRCGIDRHRFSGLRGVTASPWSG